MRASVVFPCLCAAAALLVLGGALRHREWPVTVTYRYSAQEQAEITAPQAEQQDTVFPLDLNLATRRELMAVPRIGEVLSGRIVQYREALGGYTDFAQLAEIKGISDATLEHLRKYLVIDAAYTAASDDRSGRDHFDQNG